MNTKHALFFAAFSLVSNVATAGLVETDFMNSGDGLLFLDTDTNKEWIDVAKTTGMSVNDFFGNSIYSNSGFQLAKQDDLFTLYTNAGATDISLNGTYTSTAGNAEAATLLAGVMEHNAPYAQTSGNRWIHGYMDFGSDTHLTLSRFLQPYSQGGTASFGINTNGQYWNYNSRHNAVGIWAFRDIETTEVPEPSSFFLLGLGLAGLGAIRKQQTRKKNSTTDK